MMINEIQIDQHLREEARGSIYIPRLTAAQLEVTAKKYREQCSECGGKLTEEDWQADVCPSCGQTPLIPF